MNAHHICFQFWKSKSLEQCEREHLSILQHQPCKNYAPRTQKKLSYERGRGYGAINQTHGGQDVAGQQILMRGRRCEQFHQTEEWCRCSSAAHLCLSRSSFLLIHQTVVDSSIIVVGTSLFISSLQIDTRPYQKD